VNLELLRGGGAVHRCRFAGPVAEVASDPAWPIPPDRPPLPCTLRRAIAAALLSDDWMFW